MNVLVLGGLQASLVGSRLLCYRSHGHSTNGALQLELTAEQKGRIQLRSYEAQAVASLGMVQQ